LRKIECMKILFSLFLVLVSLGVEAQMVNIESQRMQTDSVRFAGNMNFNLAYQENNSISLFMLKSALATQYKSKSLKDIFMVLGNFDLTKSGSQEFSNSAFGHFRYNRKFSSFFRWEAFAQVQYNKLLSVGIRTLAGTGPRLKLLNKKNGVGYLGTLYMYEYEETTELNPEIHRNHRLSSYITFSISIPKIKGEFVTTSYYQPRLDKFNDFRFSNQSHLAFHLTQKLRWTTGFSFLYDEFPPAGVSKRALSLDQGFRIEF